MRPLLEEPDQDGRVPDRPLLRDDPKFASGKIAFFQYFAVAVFLFLVTGYWDLQVRNPDFYNQRAERNRVKSLPILAPRGKILDRDGRIIVDNHSSFSLILSRENLRQENLDPIAQGLNLDYDELLERLRRFDRSRPRYEPIRIKEELTRAELAFVEAHRDEEFFPEMEVIHAQRRLYPRDQLAAHLIGYTGEISEAELDMAEFAAYDQGDIVGKAGLERQYNDWLRGIDGQRQVVVDNLGREHGAKVLKEAIPGRNLHLTIDLDLQVVAELGLEGRKGAVVALDPRTGEILAMVSRPAYDPNKFAVRIRSADWRDLVQNPDHPLLNRAIQAQLAPGSTFKPIVALAGLESGLIDPGMTTHCSGGASFYGHYHRCHKRGGHGTMGFYGGMAQSCDVFFYNVGNRIGVDRIAFYSEMAGLGQKTGIDLPQEREGVVPSTRWKVRRFREKWYPGETISVAIGQGALTVTPLQLAHAIGGLVMRGVWHQPRVSKEAKVGQPRVWSLQEDNVRRIMDGLYAVVNDGGTGGRARIPGIEVSGKTGTAQVVSNQFIQSSKQGHLYKDNAWFFGYAPREHPEIVVVALLEGGEHGYLAAPIVRDVIKVHFDKKSRQKRSQPQTFTRNLPPAGAAATIE
ncbi:MAG: penicillin-binding protein 2 [Bryobacterales bacterium]|nr:penicillin-binding protein 2 [Bryobacterales bacterium]